MANRNTLLEQILIVTGDNLSKSVTKDEFDFYQKPNTRSFINESLLIIDYPVDLHGEQYRPNNIITSILDSDTMIANLSLIVTSDDQYNGDYNSIGNIYIDNLGKWQAGADTNAYRLDDGSNTYVVFNDVFNSWVMIVSDLDHNNIDTQTGGTAINLHIDGQLPASFGEYVLDTNFSAIDSQYFSLADVAIEHNENTEGNSFFTIDFGAAKPAGIIFYK